MGVISTLETTLQLVSRFKHMLGASELTKKAEEEQ